MTSLQVLAIAISGAALILSGLAARWGLQARRLQRNRDERKAGPT